MNPTRPDAEVYKNAVLPSRDGSSGDAQHHEGAHVEPFTGQKTWLSLETTLALAKVMIRVNPWRERWH